MRTMPTTEVTPTRHSSAATTWLLATMVVAAVTCAPATSRAQTAPTPARPDSATPPDSSKHYSVPSRVGAAVTSAHVGFGLGHVILGDYRHAKRFALTQGGGLLAAAVGFGVGLGYGGRDKGDIPPSAYAAAGVGWAGLAVYAGSRVWEFVDVVARPARHNAAVRARTRTPPVPASSRVSVTPTAVDHRVGLAVSLRW